MDKDPFGFRKAIGQQDFGEAPAMERGEVRNRLNRIYAVLCENDAGQRCRNETVGIWNAFNPSNPATDADLDDRCRDCGTALDAETTVTGHDGTLRCEGCDENRYQRLGHGLVTDRGSFDAG